MRFGCRESSAAMVPIHPFYGRQSRGEGMITFHWSLSPFFVVYSHFRFLKVKRNSFEDSGAPEGTGDRLDAFAQLLLGKVATEPHFGARGFLGP